MGYKCVPLSNTINYDGQSNHAHVNGQNACTGIAKDQAMMKHYINTVTCMMKKWRALMSMTKGTGLKRLTKLGLKHETTLNHTLQTIENVTYLK